MKRILAAGAALCLSFTPAVAADLILPTVPSVTSPVSAVDWTGFYVGATGGVAGGDSSLQLGPTEGPAALELKSKGSGFLFGAQVGADMQLDNNFVLGVVGDIAGSTYESSMTFQPVDGPPGDAVTLKSRLDYLATLRARAGVAFDSALVYVHGGVAAGHVTPSLDLGGDPLPDVKAGTRVGFTVGAGIQYKLSDNVSVQTEYAFTDLGRATVYDEFGTKATQAVNFHAVKVGVNYHF